METGGPMTKDANQESGPLHDRAHVRMFTLADYVAEEPSGKLYISGAGLEWIGVPVRTDPDSGGYLLSCFVVIRLAFPSAIARDSHFVEVRALDDAGQPVGPESLFKVEMRFDVERAPLGFTELSGNLPIQIRDFPLQAIDDRVLFLHLVVDEILLSRLPVAILLSDSDI
jgi:hypothetical protein